MALVQITFDVHGEKQYARRFELAAALAEDLTDPLTDAADIVRRSIGDAFLTEGASHGRPWQALSLPYARWKEAVWGPRPILVASGRMRGELLAPGAFMVGPQRMVYEPHNEIAGFHQFGTRHMPARKMVELTLDDRRDIDRAFQSWVVGVTRGIRGGLGG